MSKKVQFAARTNSGSVYYIEQMVDKGGYWTIFIDGEEYVIVALVEGSVVEQCYKSDMAIKTALDAKKAIPNNVITLKDFHNKMILYVKKGMGVPDFTSAIMQVCGRTTPITEQIFFK
jgi:hypothetical protein